MDRSAEDLTELVVYEQGAELDRGECGGEFAAGGVLEVIGVSAETRRNKLVYRRRG